MYRCHDEPALGEFALDPAGAEAGDDVGLELVAVAGEVAELPVEQAGDPPEMTTPAGPGGRPGRVSAASAAAPEGSATIFRWSKAHLMAVAMWPSVTVTTSSSSILLTSQASPAGLVCRSPSAIVSGTAGSVTGCPARRDAAVSAPDSGSTPMT